MRYSYNKDYGDLESIEYFDHENPTLKIDYKWDVLGRLSREITSKSNDQFIYDESGRFVGRKDFRSKDLKSEFRYDANGNRIYSRVGSVVTEATYDNQDRLLTWGNNEYIYNENGDLETKHNTSTDETTIYVYDVFGNLKSVTLPNSDVITYKVDGSNRRVMKSKNGTQVYRFLYQDDLKVAAELDANGNLVKRFIYGDSVNVPDYMEYDGKKYFFVKDIRGSVLKVVDAETGTVAQELEYDDWGKVLSDSNPGFQPFGFAGGIYDGETGLVRFGARDYDAETGRWTSKDPIGFNGGDMNLYGYALGDPVNFIDATGRDLTVNYYNGGSGHIGISVNNGNSYGYYGDNSNFSGSLNGEGGVLRDDIVQGKPPDITFTIKTTSAQDAAAQLYIDSLTRNPGEYNVFYNNCVVQAGNVLKSAGLKTPNASFKFPSTFIKEVRRMYKGGS